MAEFECTETDMRDAWGDPADFWRHRQSEAPSYPFAPVATAEDVSWRETPEGLEVEIVTRGKAKRYLLTILPTGGAGGLALRWERLTDEGEPAYEMLLNVAYCFCSCKGGDIRRGCKHLAAAQQLVEAGVLTLSAPAA